MATAPPQIAMYCTQCGYRNPAEAKFCAQCGTALETAADATTGSLPQQFEPRDRAEQHIDVDGVRRDLEPGTALLVAVRGPNAGARFLLDSDTVTVGRHPQADIFLDDITVSRRHVEFRRSDDTYVVADVGSLNGTYVNGTRVEQQRLVTGDYVQIGKFKLQALFPEGG